ncbi:MAG: MFS transporter [Chloroflexota bacterium]
MSLRAKVSGAGARRLSLYLTTFLTQLGTGVAIPILPELQDQFGVSIAAVSLVTALWGLARLAVDLPLAGFTARVSTGKMLLAGAGLLGAGALVSALASSFEVLLVGRIVSGAGAAVLAITNTLALLALSTPANKGRVLGIYQVALQGGASLSPVVAGVASLLFGWRAAFLVAGLGALAGLAVLALAGPSRERDAGPPEPPEEAPRQVRASPIWLDVLLANVATFVLFFMTGGIFSNVMPLFGDRLGLDAAGIGLVLSIATGLRVLVSVVGSVISDRTGRHPVVLAGFALTLVPLLLFPFVDSVVAFAALAWLMSIGRVGNTMPIAMLSDRVPEEHHGRWISRNRFIADLALFIGPVVLGVAVDEAGFGAAFYLGALLVVGVLVLMLVEWRAHRRAGQAPA